MRIQSPHETVRSRASLLRAEGEVKAGLKGIPVPHRWRDAERPLPAQARRRGNLRSSPARSGLWPLDFDWRVV